MYFYENYVRLCNRAGKTPSAVAKEIGIQKSTVTRWKNGKGRTDATVQKVADYFDVTIEELVEEQKEKSDSQTETGLTKDQIKAIEKIKNMPPEDLAKKMAALEAVLDM